MSTKVWVAYRVKLGYDAWSVLMDVRDRARSNAVKELRKLYRGLLAGFEDEGTRVGAVDTLASLAPEGKRRAARARWMRRARSGKLDDGSAWGLAVVSQYCRARYRVASISPERDALDFDVSVTVRLDQRSGRYHLVPYPGSGLLSRCLRFMARHPGLEDYHYQDQTDRPRRVSAAEWKKRGRVWDRLLGDDGVGDYLTLGVVTVGTYHLVDPYFVRYRGVFRKLRRSGARGV